MKKRSAVIVLLVTLLFVLTITGTALAGKTPTEITAAEVTYTHTDAAGNDYYNFSVTFTGRPATWGYIFTTADKAWDEVKFTVGRADLKDGTIDSWFNWAPADGAISSVTFCLYDKKGNLLGSAYPVTPSS